MVEAMDKSAKLAKKHGVKSLGSWAIPNEHTSYGVHEAPGAEAFWNFGMNQVNLARGQFEKVEIKVAISYEEVDQNIKHAR